MQKNLKIAAPAIALALLAGCAPFTKIQNDAQSSSKIEGSWTVLYKGKIKIENLPRSPVVIFDTQKHLVSGFDGCNNFHGSYVIEGGQIKARLASTRMACPGEMQRAVSSTLYQLFDQGAELVAVNFMSAKVLLLRNKAINAELRMGATEQLVQKK